MVVGAWCSETRRNQQENCSNCWLRVGVGVLLVILRPAAIVALCVPGAEGDETAGRRTDVCPVRAGATRSQTR